MSKEIIIGKGLRLTELDGEVYFHFETISGWGGKMRIWESVITPFYTWARELLDAEPDKVDGQ